MTRTLTTKSGLTALVIAASMFSPLASGTARADDWNFSNLWKARNFYPKKFTSGNHLHLRISGSTMAITNPLNKFCRLDVQVYRPDGRRILTKTIFLSNYNKTENFYLSNKSEVGKFRVRLIPRDNVRFQGKLKFYSHY